MQLKNGDQSKMTTTNCYSCIIQSFWMNENHFKLWDTNSYCVISVVNKLQVSLGATKQHKWNTSSTFTTKRCKTCFVDRFKH